MQCFTPLNKPFSVGWYPVYELAIKWGCRYTRRSCCREVMRATNLPPLSCVGVDLSLEVESPKEHCQGTPIVGSSNKGKKNFAKRNRWSDEGWQTGSAVVYGSVALLLQFCQFIAPSGKPRPKNPSIRGEMAKYRLGVGGRTNQHRRKQIDGSKTTKNSPKLQIECG